MNHRLVSAALVVLVLTACEQAEQVVDRFRDMTPYEAYQASLAEAGLAETALVRDWARAGEQSVGSAASVTLPYQEQGFITPAAPSAVAYRVTLGRGPQALG